METPDEEAIQMFMIITGASQHIALQKLLEHSGNLNGAVNAHFSEGDRNITRVSSIAEAEDHLMDIDDPTQDESFPVLPSARTMNPFSLLKSDFGERRAFGDGANLSSTAQLVSHPREVREIPGVIMDDTKQSGHSGHAPTIEGSTMTANRQSSNINDTVIIDDNDKDDNLATHVTQVAPAYAQVLASRPSAPRMDELPDYRIDIEEEMVRAAIEASKRDTESGYPAQNTSESAQVQSQSEDPELAQAVYVSLKTAEEERSVHNLGEKVGLSELEDLKSSKMEDLGRLANGRLEVGDSSTPNENEDIDDQPLVRHRRSRQVSTGSDTQIQDTKVIPSISPENDTGTGTGDPQHNETDIGLYEWGGISSLEHDEAVMLEAALFGGIPEISEYHVPYAPHHYMQNGSDRTGDPSRVPRPPSPSLTAQRLLREQQDDEYLASLQADREKELKAMEEAEIRRLEEQAAREAALEEERQKEELERQLAAKEASLPRDPSSDDENAVTLLVRMPDGSRRGRRFLKSHKLQYLFDFIDVGRQVKPASYRLVRPYPRRAFGDEERDVTFNELGLTSRQEALFLELI